MKRFFILLCTAVMMLCGICFTVSAFDGNDYDYGGDYDYDYDYDYGGNDYDYGSRHSSSSSSGGSQSGFESFLGAVVIVAVVVYVIYTKSKGGSGSPGRQQPAGRRPGANVVLPDRTAQIEQIIKRSDPDFTASDFITFVKKVYIDIEMAWCARDLRPVQPVMHENLYETTCRQIQEKIDRGVVYHYESMAINTAYLTSYERDSEYEYLTCYLNARMIDYQVDEKTGNIIKGDKTTRWEMRYKMKFVRSLGVKTVVQDSNAKGYNCPNCGAPLEISSAGKCEYCGSVVTSGQYSWVLTDFTTIRDDTVDDGIRGVD